MHLRSRTDLSARFRAAGEKIPKSEHEKKKTWRSSTNKTRWWVKRGNSTARLARRPGKMPQQAAPAGGTDGRTRKLGLFMLLS